MLKFYIGENEVSKEQAKSIYVEATGNQDFDEEAEYTCGQARISGVCGVLITNFNSKEENIAALAQYSK